MSHFKARDDRLIAQRQSERHRRRYGGWYRAGIQLVGGTHAALIFGRALPRGRKQLGSWNDVPGCPDWFYAVDLMHGYGIATVEIHEKSPGRRRMTFERIDYLRRHDVARAAILALDGTGIAPPDEEGKRLREAAE